MSFALNFRWFVRIYPERSKDTVHSLDDLGRRAKVPVKSQYLTRSRREVLLHLLTDALDQTVVRLSETVNGLLLVAYNEQGRGHTLVRALTREELFGQLVQNGPLDVARILELIHEEVEDLPVEPVENIRRFDPLEQAVSVDLEVVEIQKPFPELRYFIFYFCALEKAEQTYCLEPGANACMERPESLEHCLNVKKGFFVVNPLFTIKGLFRYVRTL